MSEEETKEIVAGSSGVPAKNEIDPNVAVSYSTAGGFALMQRQAKALASSQLIPKHFQGQVADCIIALEMAQRIGASPFAVLQNLYIVHGSPAWSSKFLIACINACGRFSPLRYKQIGTKGEDSWGMVAWAKDLNDGEVLESPEVTIAIAKAEGWFSKQGSKWQTIPELMLRYRAATFFARTYCPDLTMGIVTNDEAYDMPPADDIEVIDSPVKKHAADAVVETPDEEVVETPPETVEDSPESENADEADKDAGKDADEGKGLSDGEVGALEVHEIRALNKASALAAIKLRKNRVNYDEIIAETVPSGFTLKECPATLLKDVLLKLDGWSTDPQENAE
jgi:hypothetical protein